MKYMIMPINLEVKEQHILTLLYRNCLYNELEAVCTVEDLVFQANKVFELTPRKVRTVLNKFIKKGYIERLKVGRAGNKSVFKIIEMELI